MDIVKRSTLARLVLLGIAVIPLNAANATPVGIADGSTNPIAVATSGGMAGEGTPKEQAACRADVRRYCSAVKASDSGAFLSCLQAHRSKLSKACLAVLVSHGQ